MELKKIVEYYDNGNIKEEYSINIETGLKEGECKSYYGYNGNRKLRNKCFYRNGLKEGESKVYNYYCELDSIKYYHNGEEVSKDIYDIIKSKENAFNEVYSGLVDELNIIKSLIDSKRIVNLDESISYYEGLVKKYCIDIN